VYHYVGEIMTVEARGKGGRGPAEAAAELALDIIQCSFRIRAMGRSHGFLTSWGAGSYGFLRALALEGPQTVPDIARSRPTSRQRMQRLADELAAEGLVTFVRNPNHRRSKLVRLTAKGERQYGEMTERLVTLAGSFGRGFSTAALRDASHVVRAFGERLKTRGESDSD
jgi:DNA-binding MarR family transcriptional regulator